MSAKSPLDPSQIDLAHDWEPSGEIEAEYLSDIIRLPGFWEAEPSCEEVKPIGFCEAGHAQIGGAEPCRSRRCPHHWYRWRRQATVNLVARLAAYRAAQEGAGRRMVHAVASPPQAQRWSTQRFWDVRSEANEVLQEVGARAGVTIPHPYRASDEGEALWRQVVEEERVDRSTGKWRFFREASEDWEQLLPLTEVAPHYHLPAMVEDLDGEAVAALEAETGWNVKNIRSLPPFFVDESEVPPWAVVDEHGRITRTREEAVREGYEAMARLSMYLLSHGAVQPETGDLPQRQTVSYWGELATFDPEAELDQETWEAVQRWAEAVVGPEADLDEDEVAAGDVCQVDGCEAEAHPIHELDDWLADPRWIESLPPERAYEIWGLKVYANDGLSPGGPTMEDRPPPGGFDRTPRASGSGVPGNSATEFREWLRRVGRKRIKQNPWYQIEEPA